MSEKSLSQKLYLQLSTYILAPISGVLFIFSIVHVINSRSQEDIFSYSLFIAFPFVITYILIDITHWIRNGIKVPSSAGIIKSFLAVFVTIFFGFAFYTCGSSIIDLYKWLQSPNLKLGKISIAITLTLFIGSVLFTFRLRYRSLYGFTELLVGLAVAANRVLTDKVESSKPDFYLAFLTAAIYLVVRGLDNIHQGYTKDPKDPIAKKLYDRFIEAFPLSR